ncbi:hypothetical protein [Frankia sp. Cj3]|uniref:hypothetical protein n=1 Tax=Frankia sp. Cj3 TaxID=2880976 RepID=UPI001EF54058|nr:hypothetical protein [Frankia sp. Cj3]
MTTYIVSVLREQIAEVTVEAGSADAAREIAASVAERGAPLAWANVGDPVVRMASDGDAP